MSDSNRPPTDYKSVALPDELMGLKIAQALILTTSQALKQVAPS